MAEYIIQDTTLTGIADAIRSKTGGADPIAVNAFAEAVKSIPSGAIHTGTFTLPSTTTHHSISNVLVDKSAQGYPDVIIIYALRTSTQSETSGLEMRVIKKTAVVGDSKYAFTEYSFGYFNLSSGPYNAMPYVDSGEKTLYSPSVALNASGKVIDFLAGVEYEWIAIGGNWADTQ